jgi:hypothetical protein
VAVVVVVVVVGESRLTLALTFCTNVSTRFREIRRTPTKGTPFFYRLYAIASAAAKQIVGGNE